MSQTSPENGAMDPELEKARKSMGNRIDPDPVQPEKKEEEPAPAKPAETPATEVPADQPAPETPVTEQPKDTPPEDPNKDKPVARPEAYIPLPKYHAEKSEWEKKANDAEAAKAAAEARVAELEILVKKPDGEAKDEDIEAFMASTGFDRETVEGFLKIAEKRLSQGKSALSADQMEAVTKATAIVQEAEIEAAFNEEFTTVGEPAIKKLFPNATPEQLAKAKEHLDKVAHTKENRTAKLNHIVYDEQDNLAKLFADPAPEVPGQTKKTVEPHRIGSGKNTTLTAADFKGNDADFSLLGDLDQAVRSQIIKDMDADTYSRFLQYAKANQGGVEVMRNGQKVVLK